MAVLKSNRFWIIFIGALLLVSAGAALALRQAPADVARIYRDGILIDTVDLSAVAAPYSFIVDSESGTNTIAVENGRIRVSAADCPDESCVHQGWLSGGATPIVCLPHRLIIKLETIKATDVDAVAR